MFNTKDTALIIPTLANILSYHNLRERVTGKSKGTNSIKTLNKLHLSMLMEFCDAVHNTPTDGYSKIIKQSIDLSKLSMENDTDRPTTYAISHYKSFLITLQYLQSLVNFCYSS